MFDVCIIGGGASAMAAAISYCESRPNSSLLILEKKETLGKKLSATGNGKCNLSNVHCTNVEDTLKFFRKLGVWTRTDEQGRIYPYSEQAKDVVFGMKRRIEELGIHIAAECTVTEVKSLGNSFRIEAGKKHWQAGKVLLATGGKAAPQFGTTGDGYTIARSLGHQVTKLAPILTAVECSDLTGGQKGARAKAKVILEKDGLDLTEELGEIQFTEDGLSGICIFNLSRWVKGDPGEPFLQVLKRFKIRIDFLPELDQNQVLNLLKERVMSGLTGPEELLLTLIPERLTHMLWKEGGFADKIISEKQILQVAELLKGWKLQITGLKGWKNAQCTAGGVSLDEIDSDTMESKLVKNLYFAGEIIDYDGPCGGYNLQNAWETGIKAGKAMANV